MMKKLCPEVILDKTLIHFHLLISLRGKQPKPRLTIRTTTCSSYLDIH